MKRLYAIAAVFAATLAFAVPAFAIVNQYPSFGLSPTSIPPGGSVTITFTNSPTNTVINGQYCDSSTGPYQGYVIDHVEVTYLGTVSKYYGNYLDLGTLASSFAPLPGGPVMQLAPTDTVTILFGSGIGTQTVTTSYGTYNLEWWNATTSLPNNPTYSDETYLNGNWNVDIAGYIVCGGANIPFTLQSSFDVSQNFTVPEFGLAAAVVASLSFAGLAVFRRLKLRPF
jgi:hypothetical protein